RSAQPRRLRFAQRRIVVSDERQARSARRIGLYFAPGAFDQPALGLGGFALTQNDNRLASNTMKQRQGSHPASLPVRRGPVEEPQSSHSGTRSAAVIASGRMRSATTANLSPSTMTSATKPRLL